MFRQSHHIIPQGEFKRIKLALGGFNISPERMAGNNSFCGCLSRSSDDADKFRSDLCDFKTIEPSASVDHTNPIFNGAIIGWESVNKSSELLLNRGLA